MVDPVVTPVVVPPVVVPAATVPAVDPNAWFANLEPETRGHIQNRAWDKLSPAEAAQAAIKSYREAESKLGLPADRVLRMPKDVDDVESWKALYTKLGVPADKADYKLGELKNGAGQPLDLTFATQLQDAAHAANLTPQQAQSVAGAVVKAQEAAELTRANATKMAAQAEGDALRANWGAKFDINDMMVTRFANQMGIDGPTLKTMGSVVGGAKVMETFLKLAVASGEARFISGDGGGSQIMSVDQALARRAELMREISNDPVKAKNYSNNIGLEWKEMLDLNTIIVRANHVTRQ